MEIVVSPPPPATSGWTRLLVVLGICLPVTLLVLLPACFGFDRYVVTGDDMVPQVSRGTLLIERSVPVSDLRVDDVITFRLATADGTRTVTRRVVGIEGGQVRTAADAAPAPDPWTLDPQHATLNRVVLAVPWVGYLYVAASRLAPVVWTGTLLIGALALVLALGAGRLGRSRARMTLVQRGV